MAQEAILNVSLKDYKKNIDELRASLLGLEKDSDDYKKIAEELKDKQDKLNEVMSVGKEAVNAVDGSYNQLSATLSQLKKEWKNMEIGTPEWEAMAIRINDITNQLKDADAQVGVFTRNVGDYANAFEEAFKQAAGGLSRMPGMIGAMANTTRQLIPLIQKASTTATKGLAGVKKAIVSTGIGALIVAVGLLFANFDKIRDLFKGKDNPAELASKSFDELKKSIDTANESLELETQLMEAEGATSEQVRLKKIELIKAQQAETLAQLDNVRATIKQIEAHSKFRQWITGEKKDLEALRETEQELFNLDASQSKEITKLLNSNTADALKKKKEAADEEKKLLKETLKTVDEASKSEIEKLTEKYKKEKALLEKYHKDTAELTKQYNDNVEKINKQALDNVYSRIGEYHPMVELERNYRKAVNTMEDFQRVVDGKFPPEALIETEQVTEEMLSKAQKLNLIQGNTADEFAKAWHVAYLDFKKTASDYAESLGQYSAEWQQKQEELYADNRMSEYLEREADAAFERLQTLETWIVVIEAALQNLDKVTEDLNGNAFRSTEEAEAYFKEFLAQLKSNVNAVSHEWEHASAEVINYKNSLEEIRQEKNLMEVEMGKDTNWQWFSNTSRFYEIYDARLKAAEWYRDNLEIIEGETIEEREKRELEAEQNILKIKREYAKKHIEISQTLGNGLTSIWSSINDIYENNAKAQGKTDEEIFNQTKGSKIAVATIDTIQGALAAFMGYQELPQPYGAILGIVQAAAVTAAGMAQIAQIKATQFNSAGQNISNPNATPRMADYSPDLVSNLTGASEVDSLKNALQETPIYVSVSDINEAQVKVADRDKESSF